jgi:hypothetical protein
MMIGANNWLLPGKIFTCNHVASHRGEIVNSAIREGGKKELRSFNLFQLFQHLLTQFDRMETKSLETLCGLVRSNKMMTPYVETIWKSHYQEATNLPFVQKVSETPEK